MRKNAHFVAIGIGLALLFLSGLPCAVQAETPAPSDRWTFAVQPYLWVPSFNGSLKYSVPGGGGDGAGVDINNNSILEDLNFALMLEAQARKGRWAILGDFIYLDLGGEDSQVKSVDFSGPGGRITVPATADAGTSVTLKGVVWELAGLYRVAGDEKTSLDILLGVRYLALKARTDWNLSAVVSPPPPFAGRSFARTGSIEQGDDLWDGIVGITGRIGLGSGKWGIPYYLDVGTGSSTITWQGMTGLQYRFDWIDVNLVYRYLYYDMESGKLLQNLSAGGPALGVNFRF